MRVTIGELLGKVSASEGQKIESGLDMRDWKAKRDADEEAALKLLQGPRKQENDVVEVIVLRKKKTA